MTTQIRELALENHRRFVERAVASQRVWALKSAQGWALCDSTDNGQERPLDVMPFWSDRAYAARAAVDDWSEYEATSIPLDVLIDRWLGGMSADGSLVGTNWDAANCGIEVHPAELAQELLAAIAASGSSAG